MATAHAPATGDGPPRTGLFEVERDTRSRIWALFGLLVLVVWACLVPLSVLLATLLQVEQRGESMSIAYWAYPSFESVRGGQVVVDAVAVTVVIGLAIAAIAWLVSRLRVRVRLLKALRAMPLDLTDTYHQRLANVVDELRIAAGLSQLDVVVIRALTVNAVSFADSRGRACIGVTEGGLSRLSRPQLQAVVAHEVAHVASRDCIVATRACLLFMGVRHIADTLGRGATLAVAAGYLGLCLAAFAPFAPVQIGMFWGVVALLIWTAVWLSFVIATAGASIVDLALSRQREYAADAAAVRFTGDPASLAEALQMIEWQQLAAPAVPRALAPLSIAPVGARRRSGERGWFETHPPLADRIARLQALAHQRGQSLWERRVEVERRVKARSPAVPARATLVGAGRLAAEAVAVAGVGAADSTGAAAVCPRCGGALHKLVYEGTGIVECPACGGVGATGPQVEAILARRDWGFTPGQSRLADMIERYQGMLQRQARPAHEERRPLLSLPWALAEAEASMCPLCEEPLRRLPWSLAYPLPVGFCGHCDLYWFDRDEIEVLQILVERQTD